MKNLVFVLVILLSLGSLAKANEFDMGNGQVVTDQGRSCYFVAQVELKFQGQKILDFCSQGSNLAPVLCYRFLSSAGDLGLGQDGAFEICKGASSSSEKLNCVLDYKQEAQKNYDPKEALKRCAE